MNISAHLRLAVLAIGICLILPALSGDSDESDDYDLETKTYVIRDLKTPSLSNHVIGVTMVIKDDGSVYPASKFKGENGHIDLENSDTKVVPIDQVPVAGLLSLVKFLPELYPEALPALLSNSNPKVVARHTSVDLFLALTPAEKLQIAPADLAALEKFYGI